MPFNETLRRRIRERKSMVCVGLDVDPARLPAPLRDKPDPLFRFLKGIIEATSSLVLAYKPNLAFYESLGVEGWDLLRRTLRLIPEGIIKIGDAKRGDIGSTAEKYASALFDLGFDAVTVNPYLGRDTVTPFVRDPEKGCFLLCLTSNPSSHDFQYLRAEGKCLYEHIAERAGVWNDGGNVGLVVGATHPRELSGLRRIAPDLPFLIPGIGAQGGDLEAAVMNGGDASGESVVINSSRAILYASSGADFADMAAVQTSMLRDAIAAAQEKKRAARL
ncbi:orotidine-5'-phosphate decarboxylase [bacterium]|nr:orotidine-5'-phosphate decarboxylase [bacterium]